MRIPKLSVASLLVGTALFNIWGTLILNYKQLVAWSASLMVPLWVCLYLLPFVAIASMLNNPRRGMSITLGIFLAAVLLAGAALLVMRQ